jgi:hypothetical protein
MNILIAGLSRGSAIAVELIAGSVWPDPTFVRVERRVSTSLSEQSPEAIDCDVCMVDVLGLGLSRWSPSREAELNDYLLGRPTIVLVPPGAGGGWLDASGRTADKTAIRLQHPVSANTLKESLTQLRENLKSLEKRALVPHRDVFLDPDADTGEQLRSDKADRGKGRYGAPVAPNERMTEVPVDRVASTQSPASALGLKRVENGVAALLAACPEIEKNDYLKLVLTCLALDKPSELRLSPQSAVVFCPADNWVASNISVIIHKRMSQHPLMVQLAEATELSKEAAIDQAARLFDGGTDKIRPLDTTVWRLVYYIFHAAPPVAQANIRFQLTSFPNFTRMRMQPDLYLQLALVCMRQPQSITSLQRMFPKHDPGAITLFAVCAVLSGMASVLSDTPVQPDRAIPPVKAPGLDATRKRGFFKALLDKLF